MKSTIESKLVALRKALKENGSAVVSIRSSPTLLVVDKVVSFSAAMIELGTPSIIISLDPADIMFVARQVKPDDGMPNSSTIATKALR